jgi:hypothetical protein
MRPHSSFATIIITGCTWLVLVIGCVSGTRTSIPQSNSNVSNNGKVLTTVSAKTDQKETTKPIENNIVINIPKLMLQSPSVIERSLGKPSAIVKAMHRGQITGEERTYYLKEAVTKLDSGVRVEFYQQRAVSFLLHLDTAGDCRRALKMVGIHLADTATCDRRRDQNSYFERYVADTLRLSGKYAEIELVNSFISPEQYDTGPSGVYKILLQAKSPVTDDR